MLKAECVWSWIDLVFLLLNLYLTLHRKPKMVLIYAKQLLVEWWRNSLFLKVEYMETVADNFVLPTHWSSSSKEPKELVCSWGEIQSCQEVADMVTKWNNWLHLPSSIFLVITMTRSFFGIVEFVPDSIAVGVLQRSFIDKKTQCFVWFYLWI